MGEQNYSIDQDLKEAKEMAAALIPYVYEEDLYGKIGMNMPRLTLGALRLRLRRLNALRGQMSAGQTTLLDTIAAQHDSAQREWSTHYQKKLGEEVEKRARDLQTWIRECKDDPKTCANSYMPEALRRTMIQEALDAMTDSSGSLTPVKRVDSDLRRYVETSGFIWDAKLQPVYPQEKFWWLYGRPKAVD